MAKKNGNLPAVRPDEAQLLAAWEEKAAESVSDVAARAPSAASNRISIKGKQFSTGGGTMKIEAPMRVILLDFVYQNAFYGDKKYDPTHPSSPLCWAIGPDEKSLVPSAASPDKQSDTCATCWANKFGSGDGRGKAVKNSVRVAVMEGERSDGEVYTMTFPATSLKPFGAFVRSLTDVLKVHTWMVAFDLNFDPSPQLTYPIMTFANPALVKEKDMRAAVMRNLPSCRDLLMQDFAIFEDAAPEKKGDPARRQVVREKSDANVPTRKKFGK